MLGNLHPHLDAGELAAELLHGIDDGALAELGHVFRGVAHLVHHRAVVVTHSLQLTVLLDSLKNAKNQSTKHSASNYSPRRTTNLKSSSSVSIFFFLLRRGLPFETYGIRYATLSPLKRSLIKPTVV